MATISQALANSAAATITIASLANAAGRASTAIDNSSALNYSADIFVKVKTGASGTSATGYVDIYLIRSEDGTNYEDGFAGTDGAYVPNNATKIGIMSCVANSTTYTAVINTSMFGELPRNFCIGLYNATGAALTATAGDHAVTYSLKKHTIS